MVKVTLFRILLKIEGEIRESNYKPKHKLFLKTASDCYLQRTFYSYIDRTRGSLNQSQNL